MRPKHAATVLVRNMIKNGYAHPNSYDEREMTIFLEDWDYNVTTKRREQILVEVEKILEPLVSRLESYMMDRGDSF